MRCDDSNDAMRCPADSLCQNLTPHPPMHGALVWSLLLAGAGRPQLCAGPDRALFFRANSFPPVVAAVNVGGPVIRNHETTAFLPDQQHSRRGGVATCVGSSAMLPPIYRTARLLGGGSPLSYDLPLSPRLMGRSVLRLHLSSADQNIHHTAAFLLRVGDLGPEWLVRPRLNATAAVDVLVPLCFQPAGRIAGARGGSSSSSKPQSHHPPPAVATNCARLINIGDLTVSLRCARAGSDSGCGLALNALTLYRTPTSSAAGLSGALRAARAGRAGPWGAGLAEGGTTWKAGRGDDAPEGRTWPAIQVMNTSHLSQAPRARLSATWARQQQHRPRLAATLQGSPRPTRRTRQPGRAPPPTGAGGAVSSAATSEPVETQVRGGAGVLPRGFMPPSIHFQFLSSSSSGSGTSGSDGGNSSWTQLATTGTIRGTMIMGLMIAAAFLSRHGAGRTGSALAVREWTESVCHTGGRRLADTWLQLTGKLESDASGGCSGGLQTPGVARARTPGAGAARRLFVVGGHSAAAAAHGDAPTGGHLATVEMLDMGAHGGEGSFAKSSEPLPPMRAPRYRPACVLMGGRMLVFGGHNHGGKLASCESIDVHGLAAAGTPHLAAPSGHPAGWVQLVSMPSPRSHLAAAQQPGAQVIFIVGGHDGERRLRTILRFDGTSWHEFPARMHSPRAVPGAAFSPCGRFLYVVGGSDGHAKLQSAERFDVVSETWEQLPPMQQRRSGCVAAFGPDGRLYVGGGFDGQLRMDSVEVYDPPSRRWQAGPAMVEARSGAAVAADEHGDLFVVGGTNGHVQHASVECLQFVDTVTAATATAPATGSGGERRCRYAPLAWEAVGRLRDGRECPAACLMG